MYTSKHKVNISTLLKFNYKKKYILGAREMTQQSIRASPVENLSSVPSTHIRLPTTAWDYCSGGI